LSEVWLLNFLRSYPVIYPHCIPILSVKIPIAVGKSPLNSHYTPQVYPTEITMNSHCILIYICVTCISLLIPIKSPLLLSKSIGQILWKINIMVYHYIVVYPLNPSIVLDISRFCSCWWYPYRKSTMYIYIYHHYIISYHIIYIIYTPYHINKYHYFNFCSVFLGPNLG
jgi:hypothetical protein